jgi:hypothetical protein
MAGFMSAHEPTSRPAKLEGVIKTRAEARQVYTAIVADLHTITDPIELEGFLMDMGLEIKQIEEELPFLWNGDGDDFIGLENEIERARGRTGVSW